MSRTREGAEGDEKGENKTRSGIEGGRVVERVDASWGRERTVRGTYLMCLARCSLLEKTILHSP